MHDRRRHDRTSCRIQAEFRAGAGFSFQRPIIDISEDGVFGLVQPNLHPGARATLRFRHPWANRVVQTRAVVARRVLQGDDGGTPGLGFYLLQNLSELGAERRCAERVETDTPARMSVDGTVLSCRLVDLTGQGARVELDLGLKREDGAKVQPGMAQRVLQIAHLLRSGTVVQLAFREPTTYQVLRTRAVIARTPTPVAEGRPEYWIGLRFEVDISSLLGPARSDKGPKRPQVAVTHAGDLDSRATRELNMRSLLRSVDWSNAEGDYGTGRLVLAGPRKVLVACQLPVPQAGSEVSVILQTPEDSSAPPLGLDVLVARSDSHLVAGSEPGFVGSIKGFFSPFDESRFKTLVSWLTQGYAP